MVGCVIPDDLFFVLLGNISNYAVAPCNGIRRTTIEITEIQSVIVFLAYIAVRMID